MARSSRKDHPGPGGDALKVVAIGASAGGLDALEKFFAAMPAESGLVFVVIQHLSPDHKSMMASLLARHTRLPVIMVEDDMAIEPNRVYLIPPGAMMHMEGNHLRLTPKGPRSFVLPIDVFFQSLARNHNAECIGVILSGTGSDGTRGAVAINEAGGFLLAQDPEEAKFDGMPRSVIATGLVDAILPVEAMPERIVAHASRGAGDAPAGRVDKEGPGAGASLQPDAALRAILHLLHQLGGVNFEDYKPGTVLRRIERRMAVRQVGSLQAYLDILNVDRAEALILRHELLIPVTSFFRDVEAYAALASQVIEPLVAGREAGQTVRVWCAGVSTGEEAYSIAMLFLEAFDAVKRWPSLKLFATDVEAVNIEVAAAGSYPESIVAEISPERLERFFSRRGNRFVVKSELRQSIVFARHNLLSDPPFTKMDLVVCRNTLIYFRSHAQERVLRRLQYALIPKGHLFLGSSESLGELQRDFSTLNARHKVWQVQRASALPLDLERAASSAARASGLVLSTAGRVSRGRRLADSAVDQGQAALMRDFGPPPAVLVNAAQEVVHSFGTVQPYLRIPEGQLSFELNRMLLEPLIPVASALLFKSAREGCRVSSDIVRLRTSAEDGREVGVFVRLTALPAGEVDGQRHSLLVFERQPGSERSDPVSTMDLGAETSERIEALEQELAALRENLQATIEELETSNEEMQATNEEMMASNEELQSSNEELQSVNEELNTVNAEYQEKIEILNRTNADLESLTRVVATSTVFVDDELNLLRFSAEAAEIFRLRDTDIGRPLEDFNHLLDYPGLIDDLRTTLDGETMLTREVPGAGGRYFVVRILPYRIPSTAARGAVLNFVDVTGLHDAVERLQDVVDALGEHIAVLDPGGTIVMVNRAWAQFAAENGDPQMIHSGPGANYLEVCTAGRGTEACDAYAQAALCGLNDVLEGRTERFALEYPCDSPTEQRWFVMHARRLGGSQPGVVVSHVAITEWRGRHG